MAGNGMKLTARQGRVLRSLVNSNGWVWREDVDRIAGASNGPQVVSELRGKLGGVHCIETERVDRVDRDGAACRPGRYRLTDAGRDSLTRLGWSGAQDVKHG